MTVRKTHEYLSAARRLDRRQRDSAGRFIASIGRAENRRSGGLPASGDLVSVAEVDQVLAGECSEFTPLLVRPEADNTEVDVASLARRSFADGAFEVQRVVWGNHKSLF
jgi:hypothetical protein